MYVYGLLKTPIMSPVTQTPPRSQYYDQVADLRFLINSMSPEEVVPYFYPQIYNIADPNLGDQEFPPVSQVNSTQLNHYDHLSNLSITALARNAPKRVFALNWYLLVLQRDKRVHFREQTS